MRVIAPAGTGLSLQLVAGTYVVLLGMSVDATQVAGLLGFYIERTDHTEADVRTLENPLLFERNDRGARPNHSSERNPIQSFVWGDYAAKPNHTYTYVVTAMYGTPARPRRGPSVQARVTTERPDDGTHGVYFNRGVAASAAYEARFKAQRPDKVPNREAYAWLSRGLEEALLAFIGQAVDSRFALRAAMYEFEYRPILDAFRIARDAGADVKIVVDNVTGRDTARDNPAAIAAAGIGDITIARTRISIAHNKFIVLLRDGKPVEVWTGSTNITEGGIFGHANVGHRVRDRVIAERYLRYWKKLAANPERSVFRAFNDPAPSFRSTRPRRGLTPTVFSPRTGLDSLSWYVRIADSAQQAVFLTAAFGLTAEIAPVFEGDREYLRYLLLDTVKGQVEALRRDPDNVVSAGGFQGRGAYRTWIARALQHLNRLDYIHTKLMLVDPLTSDPLIITGSANWSDESSKVNDENMLVIRGDLRATDIYLTDFMRLFNHYRLRGKAATPERELEPAPGIREGNRAKVHLAPDDSWAQPFYVAGTPESKERLLFSAAPA
jgi:phosphatidylserine/phosphatidylglycerophosphate/cardiolipin synthase-like enzyme